MPSSARAISGWLIEDAGSKNGTFLNGRKLEGAQPLATGDEIRIGGVRVIYDQPPAARVEMTDDAVGTTHVNTVVPLQDLLRRSGAGGLSAEDHPEEREIASVIGEVSQALLLHRPLRELLEHIMGLISAYVSMDRGVLMLQEGRPPRLQIKAVRVNNAALQSEKIEVSRGIVAMAHEQKLSVIITDAAADPRFMARESIVQAGIRSALCVPLWDNKEVIGVLYADRLSLIRPFTERDLRLLTLLANLAAVKIENALLIEDNLKKEQMERELALAAKIQRDLLPKEIPEYAQLELAGRNDPCQQVGGDYYDFIPIGPSRIGIALADVSGKGVSAVPPHGLAEGRPPFGAAAGLRPGPHGGQAQRLRPQEHGHQRLHHLLFRRAGHRDRGHPLRQRRPSAAASVGQRGRAAHASRDGSGPGHAGPCRVRGRPRGNPPGRNLDPVHRRHHREPQSGRRGIRPRAAGRPRPRSRRRRPAR